MGKNPKKVRLGISIGDVNGIGMEIIIKSFLDNRMLDGCVPIVYGSSKIASYFTNKLDNKNNFRFNIIKTPEAAAAGKVNMLNCWDDEVKIEPGKSTSIAGKYAALSLKSATEDLAGGKTDVLITAPINKHNIQSETFNYPGHTEYLADYANEENPLMILVSEELRVGLVTGHIGVKEVASAITVERILAKLRVFNKSLIQDFRINKPKIAVLGLNPHNGDEGTIGDEERNIIIPAIEKAREENILALGPHAADGFFGSSVFTKFDGILAMYHDQGLAPFKALSFDQGVNFTAGLPIVRTAPDHGTAYDIVGKNTASANSFRQAIFMAIDVFKNRKAYKQLTSDVLPVK